MLILAHGYLLVILLWSPFVDSLLSCKFGMVMVIIAQYMLVCLVKHPNVDSHA
jgi:hypothetical protein